MSLFLLSHTQKHLLTQKYIFINRTDLNQSSLIGECGRTGWMERYYMNLNSSELHLLCTIETMSQSTQYSAGQSCPKSPALYQHAHTNTWINTYNNTCSCSEFSTVHWSCVYSLGKPVMYQPVSKSPGFCCNNMLKRPPSILHQFAAEPL